MVRGRLLLAALAAALGLACADTARANPRGATVISGGVAIGEAGALMTVDQSTDRAIINWQAFSNAAGETVRFRQPSATAAILNRVTGVESSVINGAFEANGRVLLINPNGVLFGTTATVNTGGLLASTLLVEDADFRDGTLRLAQDPTKSLRAVINRGRITSSGPIALVAPAVLNDGTVAAPAGAALAAGTNVVVSLDQLGLVNVAPRLTASRNVLVPPQALTGLLAMAVNNAQLVDASRAIVSANGDIELRAAEGIVINASQASVNAALAIRAAQTANPLLVLFPRLAAFPSFAKSPLLSSGPILEILLSLRSTLQGQGNATIAVGGLGRVKEGVRAFFRPNVTRKVNPVTISPALAAQQAGVLPETADATAAGLTPEVVKAALEANHVLPPGMTLEDLKAFVREKGRLPPGVEPLNLKAALEALGVLPRGLSLDEFRAALQARAAGRR